MENDEIQDLLNNGWTYYSIPWTYQIIYDEMHRIVGPENIKVISEFSIKEIIADKKVGKVKGSFLLNQDARNNIQKWKSGDMFPSTTKMIVDYSNEIH